MGLADIDEKQLAECITVLNRGGLAVIPTDTVYGLVCRAADEVAVRRLYSTKQRGNNPGPIIASSIDQLVELGIKRRYLTAVSQYWPNPISIEIPHDLNYLHQGTGRQAFRVVKHTVLKKLLDTTGPLLTTSANQTKQPTSTTIDEARKYFGDKVDFYLDGGTLDGLSSTLIRVIDDVVEVVRQGEVKVNEKGEIEK